MSELTVVAAETLLKQRREVAEIREPVPYFWGGEPELGGQVRYVDKIMRGGAYEPITLDRPVGELMTTPAGLETIVQKTVLDLELGREEVPLLYGPIYRRRENAGFTRFVDVVDSVPGRATVAFYEHLEGEEIKWGTREFGGRDVIPILTRAAGFVWTEDMEVWDETWRAEEANRALGQAENAVLNHIHLDPIISYPYAAKNITPAVTTKPTQYENDRATFLAALEDAALDKHPETGRGRRPTIILAHPANQFRIQDALSAQQIGGTIYPAIGQQLTTVILYDGYSVQVGGRTVIYPGCPTTHVFLIEPRTWFQELVKHDLRVTAGNPDVSRLIQAQIVARHRRGVYAAPANAVQKVQLPT